MTQAAAGRLDAELVLDAKAILGEGPTWDAAAQRVVWVDIVGRRLHVTDPASGDDRSFELDQEISVAIPVGGQRFLVAIRAGIGVYDAEKGALVVTHPFVDDGLRMNDGKCDRSGRLWAGSMAFGAAPGAGALYRVDPDLSLHTMVTDVTISNGIAWSANDQSMYFIDTMSRGVDVFDYDAATGAIANRRRLFDVDAALGYPDGMTIDAEGHLWIAFWDGGAVRRFAPDGTLEAEVRVPCARPTSCVFGGDDLSTLFITSARDELSASDLADQPLAGGLFAVRPGVAGTASNAFAGSL